LRWANTSLARRVHSGAGGGTQPPGSGVSPAAERKGENGGVLLVMRHVFYTNWLITLCFCYFLEQEQDLHPTKEEASHQEAQRLRPLKKGTIC